MYFLYKNQNGAENVITRVDDFLSDESIGDAAQMKAEYKMEQSITANSVTPPPNQKLKVKVIFSLVNSFLSMKFF